MFAIKLVQLLKTWKKISQSFIKFQSNFFAYFKLVQETLFICFEIAKNFRITMKVLQASERSSLKASALKNETFTSEKNWSTLDADFFQPCYNFFLQAFETESLKTLKGQFFIIDVSREKWVGWPLCYTSRSPKTQEGEVKVWDKVLNRKVFRKWRFWIVSNLSWWTFEWNFWWIEFC